MRAQVNRLAHPSRVYQPGRFRWVLIDCVARLRCELLLTLVVQLERDSPPQQSGNFKRVGESEAGRRLHVSLVIAVSV